MKLKPVKCDAKGWPLEIPWPEEGEWTTHRMVSLDGKRCCISGWGCVAFYGRPVGPDQKSDIPKLVYRSSKAVHDYMQAVTRRRGFAGYVDFNNDPKTTDADRANVWAETWRHFGYEAVG